MTLKRITSSLRGTVYPINIFGLDEEECRKAIERLGATSLDTMKWALRIAQCDLGNLSAGDLGNLQYEIALVAVFGANPKQMLSGEKHILPFFDWSGHPSQQEPDAMPPTASQKGYYNDGRLPSVDTISAIQTSTQKHLKNFLEDGTTTLTLSITRGVSVHSQVDEPLMMSFGQPIDCFSYVFLELLGMHGHRVRRCPECIIIFLADRRNQAYCSVRCQSRVATRRYRGIPDDRKGKRGRPPKSHKQIQKKAVSKARKRKAH